MTLRKAPIQITKDGAPQYSNSKAGPPAKVAQGAKGKGAMLRTVMVGSALLVLISVATQPGSPQTSDDLQRFFRQDIGLSEDQITAIRSGQPVAKTMPSRTPDEVFLFGAIYIHAAPERYLQFARDFNRLRKIPANLALGVFSNPPQLSDLKGFAFDSEDIHALKNCQPGDCPIQMPASSIQNFKRTINWSAPDVDEQVNQLLQITALQRLLAYQHVGDQALGVYDDKPDPTEVAQQFAYMLSYNTVLPERLPDFYHYLLSYPDAKPANVENTFYWARVKFGLKPTLRVVQVVTMRGNPGDQLALAIAEKQLYASHYFETALDLSFCVRGSDDSAHPGFYLIMALGSEQTGLTGVKGAMIRKAVVGRSVASLQETLTNIRNILEHEQ